MTVSILISNLDGKRAWLCALALVFGLLAAGCPASPRLFRTGVAGTVVTDSYSKAGALATVYLADANGKRIPGTETRANQAGKFRISVRAGTYEVVASDNAGNAAFLSFSIRDGELLDVGPLLLAPCAVSSPNSSVYAVCPDAAPPVAPPTSFTLPSFAADRVEATLYGVQSPSVAGAGATSELFVVANDDAHALEIDVWVPSSSPYFQAGTYSAQTDAADPAASSGSVAISLVDYTPAGPVYYLLTQGTLAVQRLDGVVGGAVSLTISNATFAWADPTRPILDTTHTITVGTTNPAIAGTIYGESANGGTTLNGPTGAPGATPAATPTPTGNPAPTPPSNTSVTMAPGGWVELVPDNARGVNVFTYSDLGSGAYFALTLDIAAAYDSAGTFQITNQVSGAPGSWSAQVYGQGFYSNGGTGSWQFILRSGTLSVSRPGHVVGDPFAARLTNASFVFLTPSGATDPSATLSLADSGTLSGTISDPTGTVPPPSAPWTHFVPPLLNHPL